jgi:hypothetical protein
MRGFIAGLGTVLELHVIPIGASLPHHADEYRPHGAVLLAVDQEVAEPPGLRMPPELADPLGPVEVGQAEDVEEFGASRRRASRRSCGRRSSSSGRIRVGAYVSEVGTGEANSAVLEGDDRHRRRRHSCLACAASGSPSRGGVRACKPEKTVDLPAPCHPGGVERVGRSMLAALGPADAGAAENRPFDDRAVSLRCGLDDRSPGKFEHLRRWHRRSAGSGGWWRRDSTALRVLPIDGDQHPHPS